MTGQLQSWSSDEELFTLVCGQLYTPVGIALLIILLVAAFAPAITSGSANAFIN